MLSRAVLVTDRRADMPMCAGVCVCVCVQHPDSFSVGDVGRVRADAQLHSGSVRAYPSSVCHMLERWYGSPAHAVWVCGVCACASYVAPAFGIVFVVFTMVLLFNLLIAVMSEAYEDVREREHACC